MHDCLDKIWLFSSKGENLQQEWGYHRSLYNYQGQKLNIFKNIGLKVPNNRYLTFPNLASANTFSNIPENLYVINCLQGISSLT